MDTINFWIQWIRSVSSHWLDTMDTTLPCRGTTRQRLRWALALPPRGTGEEVIHPLTSPW